MWLIFGAAAIITAILNVIWTLRKREAKWFRFISLSCTALTLCAFYTLAKGWVLEQNDSQLLDVMPALSVALWFLTVASVTLNGVSLFKKHDK